MLYNVFDNYGYFATYELLEENLPNGMDWEEAVDLVRWQELTQKFRVSWSGEYATLYEVSYAMADEADIIWDESNLQAIIEGIENLEGDFSTPDEACAVIGSAAWLKGIQLLYELSENGLLDEVDEDTYTLLYLDTENREAYVLS